MLLEWLGREGGIVLSWWLLATLAGAAALPLCLRLLGGLPDRGYTLARPAGLLLTGFVFWLLASFGFLRNSAGAMILAWVIVLAIALVTYFGVKRAGAADDLRAWWRENKTVVIVGELLFIALLLGWSIVRAHQNGLFATEKPMELAFISAAIRTETFPPNDPWLSGYAISYYYFGYVMAAMLSTLSGIASTVGFNMMIALLFALTGLGAFGVVYNLVRSRAFAGQRGDAEAGRGERAPGRRTAVLVGLLAMIFVALLGNFQLPLVEIPYQTGAASSDYLSFWDLNSRQTPRESIGGSEPEAWDYWWWFRSARVLNDRNLDGGREEVIDEFPQFSFLLADVHPHVLALPFAVLALGLALNVLLSARAPRPAEIVFYGLCIGGLIFLNTWDGPIYLIALVGAEALRRLMRGGRGRLNRADWLGLAGLGVVLLAVAVLFYLPFLIGFRSQLAGVLPNLIHPTLFAQYFVMFGPFLLILTPFLIIEARRAGTTMNWRAGIQVGLGLLLALIALMLVLALLGALIPGIRTSVLDYVEANGGWGVLLPTVLGKRLTHALTALSLAGGVILIVGRLFPRVTRSEDDESGGYLAIRQVVTYPAATGFALLLVGIGVVLTLVPEFVYLRDNFSTRMNTVFKFYYQAWLVFALASAYAVYTLFGDGRLRLTSPAARAVIGLLTAVALVGGLLYPVLGIHNRMFLETGRASMSEPAPLTLDGGPSAIGQDDYLTVMCFGALIEGDDVVVVERVGGSYDVGIPPTGLTGRLVGIPVVLNWPGHQSQWRGATYGQTVGTREQDIDRLYADPTWRSTVEVINRYGIDYIFFGTAERHKYGSGAEIKFLERLPAVCERGSSRYYRVDEQALAQE